MQPEYLKLELMEVTQNRVLVLEISNFDHRSILIASLQVLQQNLRIPTWPQRVDSSRAAYLYVKGKLDHHLKSEMYLLGSWNKLSEIASKWVGSFSDPASILSMTSVCFDAYQKGLAPGHAMS